MKKTTLSFLFLFLFAGISAFLALPTEADAASHVRTSRTEKAGKYYIWGNYSTNTLRISTSKSGNGTVLATPAAGRRIGSYALSNGSYVYYLEVQFSGSTNTNIGYIYRIKTNKTGKTYLGKIKNAAWPNAYYNNCLYFSCYAANDPTLIHTYRFHLKTKKTKKVVSNFSPGLTYGKYLVGRPNSGAAIPLPIYIYNCKTNKKVRITKVGSAYARVGKKLYYGEYINKTYQTVNTFRIRSCNFTGSGKKTIVKSIKASELLKITSTYVYYNKYTGSEYKYYRYNLKTKKTTSTTMPG